ncbi:hypothetical protein [Lacticaseibacillus daqingensis]|uniref:hypothetical protein n=1 Tax=Lacticaseibacillus daqingensis TaxID=2486014 RepID=UPI000F7B63EC|nr:hypothetical protein [Lacticaseibacillus daqingensis]
MKTSATNRVMLGFFARFTGATLVGALVGILISAFLFPTMLGVGRYSLTDWLIGVMGLIIGAVSLSVTGFGFQNGISRRSMTRSLLLVFAGSSALCAVGVQLAYLIARLSGARVNGLLNAYAAGLHGVASVIGLLIWLVLLFGLMVAGGIATLIMNKKTKRAAFWWGLLTYVGIGVTIAVWSFVNDLAFQQGPVVMIRAVVGLGGGQPQPLLLLLWVSLLTALVTYAFTRMMARMEILG